MRGLGVASIGFTEILCILHFTSTFCFAAGSQCAWALSRHQHKPIDQLSFLRIIMNVMPFAAQTYTLQLQAFGKSYQQTVHTCAKRSVWLLYHKHCQVAT